MCRGNLVCAPHGGWVINSGPLVGRWMHRFDDSLLVPLQASRQTHKDSLWKEESQKLPKMRDGQHQQVFAKPSLLVQIASNQVLLKAWWTDRFRFFKRFWKNWQHIANKIWILGFSYRGGFFQPKVLHMSSCSGLYCGWPQLVLAVHREDEHTHENTKHKWPTF